MTFTEATAEIVPYPGFGLVVSPTHDWKPVAPAAYHWAAYRRTDDGKAVRGHGFEGSHAEAMYAAQRHLDP